MRLDRVVINASPLITLFRAGLHPLLPQLFPDLVVPDAVWVEVVSSTYNDPATQGLPRSDWARRQPVADSPYVAAWGLGAGETSVLSFALHHRDYTAIVDDREACAHVLGIAVIGTAGVVVLARRRGWIDSTEMALRRLQAAGLWLAESLITKLAATDSAQDASHP
jgi:predicted nucleic acid-binding protein